jgi:hypothetical protein
VEEAICAEILSLEWTVPSIHLRGFRQYQRVKCLVVENPKNIPFSRILPMEVIQIIEITVCRV